MVKARKQGRAGRKVAFGKQAEQETGASNSSGPGVPARLQKKVNRKVNFLARVATSAVATSGGVQKKKSHPKRQLSKALGDLSSLEDALKGIGAAGLSGAAPSKPRKPGVGGVGASRSRMKITKSENLRLQTVISHPQYKANPLSAIMSHLQATLPSRDELPTPRPTQGGKSNKKQGKKKKKKSPGKDMEQ